MVLRDPEAEELNGVAYTEAAAVHEIAHATAEIITTGLMVETHTTGLFKKKKTVTLQPTLTRAGFAVVHQEDAHGDMHGLFLEEGYAGYEQGEYIRELGNESGAVSDNPVLLSDANRYKGTPLERFATITKDATGQLKIAAGMRQSVPAVTLEQLFNHDPELLPLIRKSRGSVDALREVPKRINAIMPGLYQRMQGINMKAPDGVDQAAHLMVEVVQHLDGLSKAGTEPESVAA